MENAVLLIHLGGMGVLEQFRHMFKLDPAKAISDEALEKICLSGTDALVVGGTDNVTFENTVELLGRVRRFEIPVFCETTHPDAVVPGFDGYLIPLVLNAQDPYWIFQAHQETIKRLGALIPWERCMVEGYIILNPSAKAAMLTKARTALTAEDVIAYARLADSLLKLPYVYLEYSGRYGDLELVRRVKRILGNARLIYGGGIDNGQKAGEMSAFADLIVVGNVIYEDLDRALETVFPLKNSSASC